ncbi:ferrous iron transport protein B [Papillibacter cinnamivorans]|uniref:Ferrous iron transport protein B n=1 Tax=Papillibacter cinnamivorans DSM 12816 TaxID=1122930 RepID=A0A1W2C9F2_9FIRM|nr:ferrous iron transport protein B [Papillibacter cinnamivorans]SMC81897.1 ferrous iron transport protein B [Papillibacter cinnamivorans DSM 12816]
MPIKIALAGNPNSGKTTLFNSLTGSSQYVGNWPGVTVEKKEGRLKGFKDVIITDLPGIYSLSPYTLEEVVSRNYILEERPDAIINLVDASNIERNLYLTTQVLELGIPVIVALNMIDLVNRDGDRIDADALSRALGCRMVGISALKEEGTETLAEQAVALARSGERCEKPIVFSPRVEMALKPLADIASWHYPAERVRWYSVKLLERDQKLLEEGKLTGEELAAAEEASAALEREYDDDCESIIANERYNFITELVDSSVIRGRVGMSVSDRIDSILTNRFLALPVFAAIMGVVYYVSVSWLGAIGTNWTREVLFGAVLMPGATAFLNSVGAAGWLTGLIVDGILGGVGSVLSFVPQMMLLFFFLAFLEDCGYMSRVAFIMDRIFRKFGLSGKSFIPLLISSGCGVPGIMASRTIENEKDRRMTIIVTTFIPCGAKLPIIALIGGALFPGSAWVAPAMYFLGVAMVVFSGLILKKTRLFLGDPSPFVMEMPRYHLPGLKSLLTHVWERSRAFIVKAGTVIFVACTVIWFLSNFGVAGSGIGLVSQEGSFLAAFGGLIDVLFVPLGFGNWQATVATLTGLAAKENVVGTLGVLLGSAGAAEKTPELLHGIANLFTSVSALSFLAFNLLCAPCVAAMGAIRREMGSWKWTLIALGYQTGLAYAVALVINQLGSVLVLGRPFSPGTAVAFVILAAAVWLVVRPEPGKKGKRPGAPAERETAASR